MQSVVAKRGAMRARYLNSVWGSVRSPLATSFLAMASFAGIAAGAYGAPANLPSGGTVTSGTATVGAPSGTTLTVSQSSAKATINWQGFSIGQGYGVTYNNGSGATLNRVTGSSASSINGNLSATGSIFLINPNGVVVGKTGVVSTGGSFVASTLNESDSAFNAGGDQTFSGTSTASVVNYGKIGSLGGDVVLIGTNTANSGEMDANNGTAGLAAGSNVTLRDTLQNGGKLAVNVGGNGTTAANSGTIKAAEAELRANGGNVYALAGNTNGLIQATGVSGNDGRVFLTAGGGSVQVQSTNVVARGLSGAGGGVNVAGGSVSFSSASIDATGPSGGGQIYVNAGQATTDTASKLNVSATSNGNGGVVVINAATNNFAGQALAHGAGTGNGGFVETIGQSLTLNGASVDTSAPHGATGTWMIDLSSIKIDKGLGAILTTGLNTNNVVLSNAGFAPSDITVSNNVGWSSANALSLVSTHDISTLGSFGFTSTGGGALNLSAADNISFGGNGGIVGSGVVTLAAGNNDALAGSAFVKTTGAGSLTILAGQNITGSGSAKIASTGKGAIVLHAGDSALVPAAATQTSSSTVKTAATIQTASKPNSNATGTIQFSGSVQVASSGGGNVTVIYNPTNFGTATNFSSFVTVTGGGSYAAEQLIHTLAQLESISSQLGGSYALGNDIDASATLFAAFTPIGNSATPFTGTFDGQGFSILDLTISQPNATDVGLFGVIGAAGTVKNVSLVGGSATGSNNVGMLAGENDGTVLGAFATGNVTAVDSTFDGNTGNDAGGLIGLSTGFVNMSASSGAVTGLVSVGGLIGNVTTNGISQPVVENSFATGDVTSVSTAAENVNPNLSIGFAGGLVGSVGDSNIGDTNASLMPLIQNDYASGNVSGAAYIGGLAGLINAGQIQNSYATGNVSGIGAGFGGVGGLVGLVSDRENVGVTVSNSWASGDVVGDGRVGGLVGMLRGGDTITNSFATGSVTAVEYLEGGAFFAGGLVGFDNGGTITNSYATGNVDGPDTAGGLVGRLSAWINGPNPYWSSSVGSITDSYSTGTVTGIVTTGGLVGANNNNQAISTSYYNADKNPSLSAVAAGAQGGAVGLTDAQMRTASSFGFAGTFGTLGSAAEWVIVDTDGSINNANGAAGGTTPMLLSEYSTTIANSHQLQLMELNLSANYTLAGNINADDTATGGVWGASGFIPVGANNSGGTFAGTFNGNGFAVDGLTINDTTTVDQYWPILNFPGFEGYGQVGLFGIAGPGSLIENVSFTNANVSGGLFMGVGIVAGSTLGTIEDVLTSGSVQVAGGVTTTIGPVKNNNEASVGGLVGAVSGNGLIDNSSSSANVSGGNGTNAGGLAGSMALGGTITNSHASGNVSSGGSLFGTNQAESGTGGLVGAIFDLVGQYGNSSLVSHSYATGNVSAGLAGPGAVIAGGLAGYEDGGGLIENSYATGNVQTGLGTFISPQVIYFDVVGGLIGTIAMNNGVSGAVTTSYATGNVQGGSFSLIGGFIGFNSGTISDSYATGAVSTSLPHFFADLGGFTGGQDSNGAITESYTNSPVATFGGTPSNFGGFIGFVGGGTYAGDYWNTTTGIANSSQGAGNVPNAAGIAGLSQSQLSTASSFSFAGDFGGLGSSAVWAIVDNDGSVNNAAGAAGGTTPLLLSEYSTTITTAHQLELMALNLSASYTLGGDVNAEGTAGGDVWSASGFVPVGSAATPFNGTLNGQGNAVSNLTINLPTSAYIGLFSTIGSAGTVENLSLVNANVTGGNAVGILAGQNNGLLTGDSSGGAVTAVDFTDDTNNGAVAGGLVGINTGTIDSSNSSVNVTGFQQIGGLVGVDEPNGVTGSAITNSFATGNVAAVEDANEINAAINVTGVAAGFAGGLVGESEPGVEPVGTLTANLAVTIANDYATGNVSGDQFLGGMIGLINNGTVTNVYATGTVTGNPNGAADADIGGLIGYMSNRSVNPVVLSNAWASGNVSGVFNVGGLVGMERAADLITNSYATGNVTGDQPGGQNIGGLAGQTHGNIANSYYVGTVSGFGDINVGGLVGQLGYETNNGPNPAFFNMAGSITDSWVSATVFGGGAVVARIQPGASSLGIATPSVSNVYYNSSITPLPAFGHGDFSAASATGLTTAQMQTVSSFSFASQFGGLGSGATWVIVDQDGSLNNANGAAGGTMPLLLSTYTTNIANAQQLQLMELNLSANYTLAGNIDATGTAGFSVWGSGGFIPIGANNAGGSFTGTFEGNNYTINGLTIDYTTAVAQYPLATQAVAGGNPTYGEVGLFGIVGYGGTVGGVSISNANVTGGDLMGVGILAGADLGTIVDASSSGTVQAGSATASNTNDGAGGLVDAVDYNGTITNSSSSANVSGGNGAYVGGLVGAMIFGGAIYDSHASGNASTGGGITPMNTNSVGGLVGIIYDLTGVLGGDSLVESSYATGSASAGATVGGNSMAGGLVGAAGGGGNIDRSYSTGSASVTGGPTSNSSSGAGGFIGIAYKNSNNLSTNIVDSFSSASASAQGPYAAAGGFVGFNIGGAIGDTYATGPVTISGTLGSNQYTFAGGFVGQNLSGEIDNSYATGSVTFTGSLTGGFDFMGGFSGDNETSITSSYATGALSGIGAQGGFSGLVLNAGSFGADYWDTSTSISNPAQGTANVPNEVGISGLTTAQLQSGLPAGYWNALWAINPTKNGGLPYLFLLPSE